jgi:hypothetical protein
MEDGFAAAKFFQHREQVGFGASGSLGRMHGLIVGSK